jgi:leader peptidase (prepilin peptidase)/N-methyltransferase
VTAIAILLSALIAAVMALAAPVLLRRLPAPEDEPDLRFADLATLRFRLVLLGVCLAGGLVLLLTLEPQLWPVWAPLAAIGPLLGLVDAHTGFLPIRLNYLALALVAGGVLASCWLRGEWQPALLALVGGVGATACYGLLWWTSRGQFGFGDVRLAGLLGVATGATSLTVLLWSFVLGSFIGAFWALAVRLARRGREFPYGPSMLLGPPAALVLSTLVG